MDLLTNFLVKYQNITPPDGEKKKQIIEAVKKVTEIELEREQIKLQKGVCWISASPAVKSVIHMHKAAILAELEGNLGMEAPREMR